jgi:hypothetical protein
MQNFVVDFAAAMGLMLAGILIYAMAVLFVFFLRRQGWLPGERPKYSVLGNALLKLQHLAQPERQYVLEETEKETAEEDDEGGPDDPTAHRKRQAAKGAVRKNL